MKNSKEIHKKFKEELKNLLSKYNAQLTTYDEDVDITVEFYSKDEKIDSLELGSSVYGNLNENKNLSLMEKFKEFYYDELYSEGYEDEEISDMFEKAKFIQDENKFIVKYSNGNIDVYGYDKENDDFYEF